MFQVKDLILDILELVLRISFEFTPHNSQKNPRVAKVGLKNNFELLLKYENIWILLKHISFFMLRPTSTNTISKKVATNEIRFFLFISTILKYFSYY